MTEYTRTPANVANDLLDCFKWADSADGGPYWDGIYSKLLELDDQFRKEDFAIEKARVLAEAEEAQRVLDAEAAYAASIISQYDLNVGDLFEFIRDGKRNDDRSGPEGMMVVDVHEALKKRETDMNFMDVDTKRIYRFSNTGQETVRLID